MVVDGRPRRKLRGRFAYDRRDMRAAVKVRAGVRSNLRTYCPGAGKN